MNIKILLPALLLALLPAHAQEPLTAKDTITDSHIVPPESFDTDTKALQDNWYMQRYAVLDERARHAVQVNATDEVYVERLQRLPNVIEMPYNQVVKAYIEMYANRKPELVEKMLGMSLYYMPIFEDALEKYQLPVELKYLPVIESALNPNAVSKAGATGLWQFMSSTATGEGLEVSSLVDQRRDPIASSQAAAQYLQKLYNMYGDWALAIAAYNCGPGNVNKAIKRAGDQMDYWVIYPFLPEETRGYVPAFIAANYIMNYYAEHGISHALARKPIVTDTVHVHHYVHFQQISDVLGVPIDEVRILNPQYRKDVIPGHIKPYSLVLPSVQAYCFAANEDSIARYQRSQYVPRDVVEPSDGTILADSKGRYVEELVVIKHTVKKGETLKSIANKYGVTAESIRKANNLSTSKVKTGRVLKINTYQKKYITESAPEQPAMAQMQTLNTPPTESTPIDSVAMARAEAEASADSTLVAQAFAGNAPEVAPEPAKPAASAAPASTGKSTTGKSSGNTGKSSGGNAGKSSSSGPTTYIVKSGDSLYKIANRYGVSVDALMKANNLKNSNIQPKQKLVIPAKK